MSARGLALDEAAWAGPWRDRCVRDKAVVSLGLLACALLLPPWPAAPIVALAAIAVMLGPARVAPRVLLRSLGAPLLFIVIGAASVAVSVSWQDGPRFLVTGETVARALSVLGRALAATLAMFVLATTTPMVDLFAALRRLRIPDACIDIAGLMYRLIFVLLESLQTIREAQAARLGYANRRATLQSTAMLAGAVLQRAWSRARRLDEGLTGRGYTDALTTLDEPGRASGRFLAYAVAGLVVVVAASLVLARVPLPGWGG